jgi:protein-S-isoprenylcysteine O-methyltransferase Ste14
MQGSFPRTLYGIKIEESMLTEKFGEEYPGIQKLRR